MSTGGVHNRSETRQQAISLLQKNRIAEAKDLFAGLCRSDKTDAESHYLLGVVNGRLGYMAEAADCFRQAAAIQPQMFMAHYGLGTCLKAEGRFPEAVESFRQAVRVKPDLATAHFEMGTLLHKLGRLDEAKDSFRLALRHGPTADGYFSLGNIWFSQGVMTEAIACYRQALKMDVQRADIHNALGYASYSLCRFDEAIDSFRRAINLQPDFILAHNNLGRVLTTLGRIDEAVVSFREALRLRPDFVEAASNIITAYEWVGDYQKAGEQLQPLIERYPDNPGVIMSFARLCNKLGRCGQAIDLVESILQRENLPALDRRQLHFSAGKLYDAMGDYDKAFMNYQKGNAIQAPPYDPARHASDIDAVIAAFSGEIFRKLPRASFGSERPVFIIGMPRSGTSLVEQILASHPGVHGAGELMEIGRIVSGIVERLGAYEGFARSIQRLTTEIVDTMARDHLGRLEEMSAEATRVTDKMPHNFLHLGVINLLFPKARVIHCVRDPLDTCLSIYFQYFYASHSYACDLTHIGTHYRDYRRLMAHWRRVLDIPMLEVSYEDLVTDPDGMIPKLVEFCGLEWDPSCLRFYENRRFVNTASYDQVRQPLHPKSIGRWKHYEKYLAPLKAALETD